MLTDIIPEIIEEPIRAGCAPGNETIGYLAAEISRLRAALKRIAEYEGAPDIDATGEWQTGLHCGVEDRDCRDRYEGADYGHTVGVEKGLEWAANEAKHALQSQPNTLLSDP